MVEGWLRLHMFITYVTVCILVSQVVSLCLHWMQPAWCVDLYSFSDPVFGLKSEQRGSEKVQSELRQDLSADFEGHFDWIEDGNF